MKKRRMSREIMYVAGLIGIALGTVLMEKADFGMSMVVAPAYIFYVRLSRVWSFFSFGMAEYILQGVIIIALCICLRRFRISYLMAFITAVLYGLVLDAMMAVSAMAGEAGMAARVTCYIAGMAVCALGVACMFKTYLMPEAYELFVRELAEKLNAPTGRVKTIYDCVSCAIAVALSFAFFGVGTFVGMKWGTVVCALINGTLISRVSAFMDAKFDYCDALPLRKFMK